MTNTKRVGDFSEFLRWVIAVFFLRPTFSREPHDLRQGWISRRLFPQRTRVGWFHLQTQCLNGTNGVHVVGAFVLVENGIFAYW